MSFYNRVLCRGLHPDIEEAQRHNHNIVGSTTAASWVLYRGPMHPDIVQGRTPDVVVVQWWWRCAFPGEGCEEPRRRESGGGGGGGGSGGGGTARCGPARRGADEDEGWAVEEVRRKEAVVVAAVVLREGGEGCRVLQ